MGWKHQRSHPRHPPQTIYARRQPSASVPSLQLGCEVACQLPSHRTSSAQQCYELWRRHAVDGFIWDARWQTARVCEFRTTQTQREQLPEKVLADAAQTDKAFSHSTEWQTWEWGGRVRRASLPSLLYWTNRRCRDLHLSSALQSCFSKLTQKSRLQGHTCTNSINTVMHTKHHNCHPCSCLLPSTLLTQEPKFHWSCISLARSTQII